MNKFCGQCGSELNPKTGKCPNCDMKKEKNAGATGKRFGFISKFLCLALVIVAVVAVMSIFNKDKEVVNHMQEATVGKITDMKTIYVLNRAKYTAQDYENVNIYQYDQKGIPVSLDNHLEFNGSSDSNTVFVYDYENAMGDFSYITELDDDLTDEERARRQEELQSRVLCVFENSHIPFDADTAYKIMCMDSEGRIWADISVGMNETSNLIGFGILNYQTLNNSGMVSSSAMYTDFGDIFNEWTYQYNDHGNRISGSNYRVFGPELSYRWEYRYEGDQIMGYTEKLVSFVSNSSATRERYYSYDDAGRKIKQTTFVEDKLEECTIYTYDENGNVCRSETDHSDDTYDSVSTYSYDKLTVPADSVEYLVNLYKSIGITYRIAE